MPFHFAIQRVRIYRLQNFNYFRINITIVVVYRILRIIIPYSMELIPFPAIERIIISAFMKVYFFVCLIDNVSNILIAH